MPSCRCRSVLRLSPDRLTGATPVDRPGRICSGRPPGGCIRAVTSTCEQHRAICPFSRPIPPRQPVNARVNMCCMPPPSGTVSPSPALPAGPSLPSSDVKPQVQVPIFESSCYHRVSCRRAVSAAIQEKGCSPMSGLGRSNVSAAANAAADAVVTPQSTTPPVIIRNCSRLGMQATPPTLKLGFGWLRRR
jgi:hypothetical protein